MDPERAAWSSKYAREPAPWRGPQLWSPRHRVLVEALPRAARVIELGAGGGKTAAALAGAGLRVVPVDWVSARGVGVVADARALPVRAGSVEGVAAFHVLDHLFASGRGALVAEAARVLRAEGVLFGRCFHALDRRARTGEATAEPGTRRRGGVLAHAFEEGELAGLLAGGFAEVVTWSEFREEKHLGRPDRRVLVSFAARGPVAPRAEFK